MARKSKWEEILFGGLLAGAILWYYFLKPLKENHPVIYFLVIISALVFAGLLAYTWVKNKAHGK